MARKACRRFISHLTETSLSDTIIHATLITNLQRCLVMIVAKSGADRMRELRRRQNSAGEKSMTVTLPQKYKERFDRLRKQLNTSISETICYMIDLATDDDNDED